jgi:glc operon protein GlcG
MRRILVPHRACQEFPYDVWRNGLRLADRVGPFDFNRLVIMITKPCLSLADIKRIAAAAEAEALRNGWKVSIAIVDDGGHLLWLQRLDGAAPISAQIATAKANTAALGQRESKVYEEMINQGRTSFLSVPGLHGLLEGGVPIVVEGAFVGAVGVSGVKSSEDVQIAKAGIAALGG